MKIGMHAGTRGYTAACKAVMDILPDVCLWLADTHRPADALNYPAATHVLRLRNPQPTEQAGAYVERMARECHLADWLAAPLPQGALVIQAGNEPEITGYDLPVAWGLDAWYAVSPRYLVALRAYAPGVVFLAPPFTSAHSNLCTASYAQPYDGVAVHAYWATGNPGWRQGLDGGRTWQYGVTLGKPTYVTEVNSNPASSSEVLAWADEVTSDLVRGATLYIAESDTDPQYVVSPRMAWAVKEGLPLQPEPPQPQPEPEPEPTPPVQPVAHYEIVEPVDSTVYDVVQGSDGTYSHGGRVRGFYAMDYATPTGTPVIAAAAGQVVYAYWQDANPISARTGHSLYIAHDNGYSTFSCHLSRFDVGYGDRVVQGQVIGLSGDPASEPDNGYGSGPHLHWEVWQGVWGQGGYRVRMEDLEAQGIAGPWLGAPAPEEDTDMLVEGHLDDGMVERIWYGNATQAARLRMAYNPQSGIGQRWRTELMAGRPLGAVQSSEEEDTASGRVVQFFTNGAITFIIATGDTYVN